MKSIGEEINTANCRKRRRIAKVKRKPVNGTWKIEKSKKLKCSQRVLKTMKPDETVKKNSKEKERENQKKTVKKNIEKKENKRVKTVNIYSLLSMS